MVISQQCALYFVHRRHLSCYRLAGLRLRAGPIDSASCTQSKYPTAMQQPIELNLRIRIFPGHIRAATIVLSIIAVAIMIQHGIVLHIVGPLRFLQRVNVVGPFVAPVTELAQFLAIGPDNHVPQTFRMIGLASYAAFFALANAASRTSMTPYVMAVLQGLPASLQGEAPPTPQQLDELVLVVPMVFMTACLGISTLMLGLDLTGHAVGARSPQGSVPEGSVTQRNPKPRIIGRANPAAIPTALTSAPRLAQRSPAAATGLPGPRGLPCVPPSV